MIATASPPATLPPMGGESLTGYLDRFAAQTGSTALMNGLARHRVDDARALTPITDLVSGATGVDPDQVRAMTMHGWTPTLRGYRQRQRHGWALHPKTQWICPSCTPSTGFRALRWRLALAPICLSCRIVLIEPAELQALRYPTEADLELTAELDELITGALAGGHRQRRHLKGLHESAAELAHRIAAGDVTGDETTGWIDPDTAALWGMHPCPDPWTMLQILHLAGPALSASLRQKKAAAARRPAPSRVRTAAHPPASTLAAVPTQAPAPGPTEVPDPIARARRQSLLRKLTALCEESGLQPRHVPTLLDPARPASWSRRHETEDQGFEALALHILIDEATGGTGSGTAAFNQHGIPTGLTSHALLDEVRTGEGLSSAQHDRLLTHTERILEAGLADYQYRRGVLDAQPRMFRLPAFPLLASYPAGWPIAELVAAWAWVHYAHALPSSGPIPHISWTAIDDFDAALDPETRMHLLEAVAEHVHGPDMALLLSSPAALQEQTSRESA